MSPTGTISPTLSTRSGAHPTASLTTGTRPQAIASLTTTPWSAFARENEYVTNRVPAGQVGLVDESHAADRQAGLKMTHLITQRTVSEH